MKLELGVLNTTDIQSVNTGKKIKVRLSDNAQMMIFRSYTKNLYSNIIGSIVRELTSNCYDSHVAAKVKYPIIVRLNKEFTGYTISFIDKGTGMSPQTIEEVYGVLFESTKRLSNDEFGAFGIGSKTPLAYDTQSFFLKTRVDGVEYFYNIYAGETSPEIELIHETKTTERNGTEVKVTIASGDLGRFLNEIKKQLYYFDNIIFEGFDDHILDVNNYTIHYGNSFVYRGDNLYSNIHICLGRVTYPIDYSALGLSSSSWQVPIAIKANIGDINVTMNREAVEYSDETIAFLKKKLAEVKQELTDLYVAQCGDIKTIDDYLKFKYNQYDLKITPTDSISLGNMFSDQNKISLTNFPYNNIKTTINNDSLVLAFYEYKLYGSKPRRSERGSLVFDGVYSDISKKENLFRTGLKFDRKVIKQAYLKHKYERFYILKPKHDYTDTDNITSAYLEHTNSSFTSLTPAIESEIIALYHELTDKINSVVKTYDDIIVPEEFISNKKIAKRILKNSNNIIPISTANFGKTKYKNKIKVSELANFKGKIFFGFREDANELHFSKEIFGSVFDKKYIAESIKIRNKEKNILFMKTNTANAKLMSMLPNARHIKTFKHLYLRRKIESLKNAFSIELVRKKYGRVDDIFKLHGFEDVDKEIAEKVKKVKIAMDGLKNHNIDTEKVDIALILKSMNIKLDIDFVENENLEYLHKLTLKNLESFEHLRIYYINSITTKILKAVIEKP